MRARARAAATIACLAILLSPRAAQAAERRAAIGTTVYAGEFPAYFQDEIEQAIVRSLEGAPAVVVELSAGTCAELWCLREPARDASVAIMIMPRFVEDDRDYQIEIVAYAVDDGQELARVAASCDVCGQRELLDAIPSQVIELWAKATAALASRTLPARLVVEGRPSGAALSLDGRDGGTSPAAVEVSLGEHELQISAAGYSTQKHRWTALSGVEEVVEYTLTPQTAGRGAWIAGWISISLGVAAVGSGAALLALDGRDHQPTCSPEQLDVEGNCPNVYTTAAAGAVALALGLAATATGVGLVIHGGRQRTKPAKVQVDALGLRVQF